MTSVRQVLERAFRRREPNEPVRREVEKSDAEWQRELTTEQFRILRRRGTERAGSAEDVTADADGRYRCAGCQNALFSEKTKFDSGTGWPSFNEAIAGSVERRRDVGLAGVRVEVICRRCGGHLGHVFRDGPRPTGERFCINGGALSTAPTQPDE